MSGHLITLSKEIPASIGMTEILIFLPLTSIVYGHLKYNYFNFNMFMHNFALIYYLFFVNSSSM